jgi:hypothetical protein
MCHRCICKCNLNYLTNNHSINRIVLVKFVNVLKVVFKKKVIFTPNIYRAELIVHFIGIIPVRSKFHNLTAHHAECNIFLFLTVMLSKKSYYYSCQKSESDFSLADTSAAEATEKDIQEEPQAVTDSTAMDDNSNEVHPCQSSLPASDSTAAVATVQPEQTSGQFQWPPEEAMDQTPAVTSTEGQAAQQHSREADPFPVETLPVYSTQQTVAHTATTDDVDIKGEYIMSTC